MTHHPYLYLPGQKCHTAAKLALEKCKSDLVTLLLKHCSGIESQEVHSGVPRGLWGSSPL
jgi:hypothetical protein